MVPGVRVVAVRGGRQGHPDPENGPATHADDVDLEPAIPSTVSTVGGGGTVTPVKSLGHLKILGGDATVCADLEVRTGTRLSVFVVYDHDQQCRDQSEAMLRRWGLEPLILDQLPTEGQTVIEKLESAIADADFGVVLATPDDEGHRAGHKDERTFRARQNVVLEIGMLLAKLGRRNVAVLLKTQENMERPSDILGLIYIPFKDDIAKDAGVSLAKAMVAAGYQIDLARL